MNFQYHPAAEKELICILDFYEGKSQGLGAEFLDELESSISYIMLQPEAGYSLDNETKK